MTVDVDHGASREAATPSPPGLVQLLTPGGERIDHPDFALDITAAQIRDLYRDMVRVRRLDAEATALAIRGELGAWPSLLGQEAAQVGSCRALRPTDMAFPTYREHGVAWCRGIDPVAVLRSFRGTGHCGWDPRVFNLQIPTIVIGSHALHATGYAMGVQLDGTDDAVVAYFGDGATSQGDVNEAFIWAAVRNVPIVFFCQNNQWAISLAVERQSRAPIYRRAEGFGFPGVQVDGNDVLACLAVTRHALDHARRGHGPLLIEAFTYRMGPHTTSDDPGRYRARTEVEAWRRKDPIDRLKKHLLGSRLADQEFFDTVEAEVQDAEADLRRRCRDMPEPAAAEIWEYVYAPGHPLMADEHARFRALVSHQSGISNGISVESGRSSGEPLAS